MQNLALHLSYHGGRFHGYEKQPRQRTVRGVLEEKLGQILQNDIQSTCAGRTDAGVHACAQLVNFKSDHALPVERYVPALNRILPWDLRAHQIWPVDADFSARYDALSRHYRFLLWPHAIVPPHFHGRVWHLRRPCDWGLLQSLWSEIQGEHDFAAFCKSGSYRSNTRIQIHWTRAWQHRELWVLEIMGQSFLYNMVRRLVGLCAAMATGKLPRDQLQRALATGDGELVGYKTAPPEGLYLYNVLYPPQTGIQLLRSELHSWPAPLAPPEL